MEDKIIGGEPAAKGVIGSEGNNGPAVAPGTSAAAGTDVPDLDTELADVTRNGGLNAVPPSFENKNGNWKTILSANPFEVLYLDYRLHHLVTPQMVQKNYEILAAFWKEKIILLNGSNREKIKNRYGEDTVSDSLKKLDAAYRRIGTSEGIALYYKELETRRISNGIKAIEDLIDTVLAGEQLFREQADKIIAKGIQNGLTSGEVRAHLQERLEKHALKPRATNAYEDVFDGKWMTDRQWKLSQARATDWLGTPVSTLEEVGEVTFHNRQKAMNRIANSNYIPVVVTQLTNADKGYEFEEIINREPDMDKRYLKIIYHLNPYLPFRVDELQFTNISQVFEKTSRDYELFQKIASVYQKGHIHIWLKESDPVSAEKLTDGYDYNNFLIFLYRINPQHPFYLKGERFQTPEELTGRAGSDKSVWPSIANAISNNQIPLWLIGINKYAWVQQHGETMKKFIDSKFHREDDLMMASVQSFIMTVEPAQPFPGIAANVEKIQLLQIEGSRPLNHPLTFTLKGEGFVKAIIYFEHMVEGIHLSGQDLVFHSQQGQVEKQVQVMIDALRLTKNKVYQLKIVVYSVYEIIYIPLEVRVVFPRTAYFLQLAKYAVIMGVFFGGIRFLLGELTGARTWVSSNFQLGDYLPLDAAESYLPDDYFIFFIVLMILLAGLVSSIFLIRKFEKL